MTPSRFSITSGPSVQRRLSLATVFLLSLLLGSGCSVQSTRPPRRPAPPVQPPPVGEVSQYTASWYGADFHGKRTASGELYDMHAMTAAHKKLPFGTRLQVTYLKTGLSTDVTVTDRGPFIYGRDLDLSYGAAQRIGLVNDGVGRVRVRFLDRDMRYVKYIEPAVEEMEETSAAPGSYTIQFGAFENRENAERLKKGLDLAYTDTFLMQVRVKGRLFNRVRLGHYPTREAALSAAEGFAYEGYTVQVFPE